MDYMLGFLEDSNIEGLYKRTMFDFILCCSIVSFSFESVD
jgi:hypothetical protein